MPTLLRRFWLPISSLFFLSLFALTLFMYFRQAQQYPEIIMEEDIAQLAAAFKQINATAGITSFEHQKNSINFLNVINFAGSEVGPMNLAQPDKWQGPYFQDNPTMQEKYYEVVHTKDGYFVVPGQGVTLANGKIMGTDIVLNYESNIPALMRDPNGLLVNDKVLAAQIPVGKKRMTEATTLAPHP